MKKLRQLKPQDVLFVGGETSRIYQHTAGLLLLDASDRPGFGFEAFRRYMAERVGSVPHFRWKLHEVPLWLDLPYWVEDENFSLDHHIRRIAVPSPGDREALAELVSYLYSRHLDRNRPLWEAWFIEGLADGRYALLQKLHHCMMDGEGASKLGEILSDFEPDAPPPEVDPAIADARAGAVPQRWQVSLNAAWNLSRMPVQAGREIYDAVRRSVAQSATRRAKQRQKPPVPTTPFSADIGTQRGFVFGSVSLADIKTVKNHFDVTVNDVVLALVGGSMRDHLLRRGELPEQSLRSFIVVSLRTEADDEFSNRIATATATLATAVADPVQRLMAIAEETGLAKREARGGGNGVMKFVQIMPPVLVNAVLRMMPVDRIAAMMGANLLVSNVRGGDRPTYMGGARVVSMYPMSVLTPGSGINFTCVSYADKVDFGVTIDPDTVPDPWLIVEGLHKALEDYLALVGTSARRRKTAARKSGVTRSKRTTAKRRPA